MRVENLRKQVKKLMVDADLDARGGQKVIADSIGVHPSSLNNALSGYRETPGAVALLKRVKKYLLELLFPEKENTHDRQNTVSRRPDS